MTAIPPNPPNPPQYPGFNSNEYAAMHARIIEQQVRTEVEQISAHYNRQLQREIAEIADSLRRDAALQVRNLVLAAVATLGAAFTIGVWAQTKGVNDTYMGYQQSVMSLQREVLAQQTNISNASKEVARETSLVAAANETLKAATQRLDSTKAEYDARLQALQQAANQKPPTPQK